MSQPDKRYKIAVVEDNKMNAELLEAFLVSKGFRYSKEKIRRALLEAPAELEIGEYHDGCYRHFYSQRIRGQASRSKHAAGPNLLGKNFKLDANYSAYFSATKSFLAGNCLSFAEFAPISRGPFSLQKIFRGGVL